MGSMLVNQVKFWKIIVNSALLVSGYCGLVFFSERKPLPARIVHFRDAKAKST